MRAKGQFWGSVITDDEVDALLRAHGEIDYVVGADGLDEAIGASTAYRDEAKGKLHKLRQAFALDGDDLDLLLLSLAPEISAGYGKIFAYLNDNLNQAYLTVDLATRVLRQERKQRLTLQGRLLPGASLIQNRLLMLNPPAGMDTHTSRRVHPAPRLLRWLLQDTDTLLDGARLIHTSSELFIPTPTLKRLEQIEGSLNQPITIVVVGGTMGMREGTAMAIAQKAKRQLARVDLDRCKPYLDEPYDLIRDLRLNGTIPFLTNVPDTTDEPALRMQMMALGTALASLPYPVFIGSNERRAIEGILGTDRTNVTVPVARSTLEERLAAWKSHLNARGWQEEKAEEIADRFYAVGGTTIARVMDRAEAECGGEEPDLDTIWNACREASRPEFSGLVQQIIPKFRWKDLILPDRVTVQLKALVNHLAHQETVFHRWGASKIRPRGYGIKALFSGGPGTGKTMCAEVIAGSLGIDLFRVDLSAVISRWVGETEKNLREIFDAAEGGNSVLLFDEADALFGSRGDVKQAQDRFANQEVSFLLQRLEVFEGCAILTTNLRENIDEAFLRRFGLVVEFPMPSIPERYQLWKRAIPEHAPLNKDLDLKYLAREFNLSGGLIINSAVNAAINAASDGEPIGMQHCLIAVARELTKIGKQVNRVHFGKHFEVVEAHI